MANRPDSEVELNRLELRFAATRVNDERAVQRLVQSIDACGQLIACIAVGEPERTDVVAPLVLIDGYRRVAALRKLGRDTARVECWSCAVSDALAQVLARSRSRAFTAGDRGGAAAARSDGRAAPVAARCGAPMRA